MKINFYPLKALLYLFLVFAGFKNTNAQGPISPTGLLGQKEIIFVWDEGSSSSSNIINHQVAKLISGFEGQPNIEQRFEFSAKKIQNDGSYGNRQLNVVNGDFDGDGIEEYVTATRADADKIRLRVPDLSKTTLTYSSSETILAGTNVNSGSDIRVLAGNFDADVAKEVILAYKDKNNILHIELYDTNNTLLPAFKTGVNDETLTGNDDGSDWGISVHDLNKDKIDEVLIGFRPAIPGQGIVAKVYKYNGSAFVAKARQLIDNNTLSNNSYSAAIAITAGDYDRNGLEDIAIGWGRADSCDHGSSCDDTFIYPLKIGDDASTAVVDSLEKITFNPNNRVALKHSQNDFSALNLQSGDLNGDGKYEIVVGSNEGSEILVADANFKLSRKFYAGNYFDKIGYAVDFMRVTDIDGKPGDEIIILDHFFSIEPNESQYFNLAVYKVNEAFTEATLIASKSGMQSISNGAGDSYRSHYSVAAGDFNGDNFRIGEGKKYVKTNIIQPLVILNAPPTHFDMLEGTVFDINSCYNSNLANCGHTATYFNSNAETDMVNTEVRSDWGISSTISGGASYLGIGVKAHLTASYGEKFSKTQNTTSTVRVSTQIIASGDDLLYATVCDYEVWEYPVFTANNQKSGYVVAVVPKLTENRWFPSKERSADGYIPKHEVGNILSYTPYPNLINPEQSEKLRGSYTSGSTDLNESTNATFEVNLANTFATAESKQKDIGLEVGASVSGWGLELSGTATYNQSEITTHTTKIESNINIGVHFGPIDRGLGEDNFNVTPYVYWAKNGALVVDYAARAILPSTGGTATWWSEKYGNKQDPAFILPWRLDPEKGLALQDQERRKQTKSISFSPREPSAGDTVTITAIINNFSLKPTDDSVAVNFYNGSPNSGGQLLVGTNGKSVFKTNGKIGAQEYKQVSMRWKIPQGIEAFPRIYAVIDPQNSMSEIHEENNVGWTVMGKSNFSTDIDYPDIAPKRFDNGKLSKCYPNPFVNKITIEYIVPETDKVLFEVYNSQGRIIKSMVNASQTGGIYKIELDGQNLRPGIYFYRLKTGKVIETNKFIKE